MSGIIACPFHRSLGKLLLMAQNIDVLDGISGSYHRQHSSINTGSCAILESKEINASLYQQLQTSKVIKYIKEIILNMSTSKFDLYLSNLKFLCGCYKTNRGIYVNSSNLETICLTHQILDVNTISLSRC